MSAPKKSGVTFGPGAASLILIFVVLSMSVLGMLSLMNGRNDDRFSQRSAEVIEAVYALNSQAEERRAQIDAVLAAAAAQANGEEDYLRAVAEALPEGTALNGRELSWLESDGSRQLDCALELAPLGSEVRSVWLRHALSAQTEGGTFDD